MKDWILIANKSNAKIYELDKKELKLVKSIDNEKARLKESELVSDSPGITMNSVTGPGGRGLGADNQARKQAQKVFTHEISDFVKKSQSLHRYNHLFIFATPSYIGELTSEFSRLKLDIAKKVNKDLSKIRPHQLKKVVEQNIFNV